MGPIKDCGNTFDARCVWEPPVATQLMIGTETKSAHPTEGKPSLPEPEPPSPPASKLGFSFEMAFPLSARTES